MNAALIFAGGTGQRMNTRSKPKQFLELHGKPIIVYTLEVFEEHEDIDGIVVVCLADWIPYMRKLVEKYHLQKIKDIVPGGETGQESIFNGVDALSRCYKDQDIILVHDGVRPLVDSETITKNIQCALEYGNAITTTPAIETITVGNEDGKVGDSLNRSMCRMAKAPQSFRLGTLLECHERARLINKNDFVDSASLIKHFGFELYAVDGNMENIKITTPMDFYIFRAIVDAREESQIFGL